MHQLSAAEAIRLLDLRPHPEGGHYRETFRDPRDDAGGRSLSTAIYFLLAAGERSHWHRIDAVEIWHWHAGPRWRFRSPEARASPRCDWALILRLASGRRR